MRRNEIANRDYFIADKYFWIGLALYAALFVAAASVFGDTASGNGGGYVHGADWSGTLIFSNRTSVQGNDSDSANVFQPWTISWAGNVSPSNQMITSVAELPAASGELSRGNEPTASGPAAGGITSMQIALAAPSSFTVEDVSPAPEPATWLAATMAAGVIAWSQRRRFALRIRHSPEGSRRED